jgi:hypothetical protein
VDAVEGEDRLEIDGRDEVTVAESQEAVEAHDDSPPIDERSSSDDETRNKASRLGFSCPTGRSK